MEIDHISQKNHQDWSIEAEIMVFFISQRAGWFLVYGNFWLINGFKSKIDKSTSYDDKKSLHDHLGGWNWLER